MPTRFTSLGVSGTATIAALVATTVTLTTVGITTATITTANVTTANVQTLSGAVISATDGGDVIEGRTVSGATLRNTAGTAVIDNNGLVEATNMSGGTVRAATLTGSNLTISGKNSGAEKRVPCFKAGGVIGYSTVTSSGTLLDGGVCN